MLAVENFVGSEKNKEKKDHWEIHNPVFTIIHT